MLELLEDVSWILYSGYPAAGDFNIRESGVANHLVIKKTTGNATFSGDVTLSKATPQIIFTDTLTNPDKTWAVKVNANSLYITETGVADRLTIAAGGATTLNGVLTANAGINIDNINIDGTTLALSSGDLTIDVAGNISLDADGNNITLKDGGIDYGNFTKSSNDFVVQSTITNGDILFKGSDGGSAITALSLNMSEAGEATFNSDATVSGTLTAVASSLTGGGSSVGYSFGASGSTSSAANVFCPASYTVAFGTNNAERMRIASDGNVGIGIASPTTKLSVKSTGSNVDEISLVHSGNTVKLVSLGQESSHGSIHVRANSGVAQARISAVNSNYFLQNVGIGTTAPSSKLHIYETTNAFLNGLTIENPNAGSSASAGMYLNCNGKTLDMRIYNALSGNFGYINSSGTLYTGLYHDGGLVLAGKSGKVGIGTTAPSGAKLDVRTNSASLIDAGATINIEEDTAWTQGLALYINNADAYNADYAAACIGVANNGSNIIITAGAKVVNNPASSNGYKTLNSTAPSVYRQMNGAHAFYGDTGKTANTLYTPTERMRIDDDGKVGIGTTAPANNLHIKSLVSAGSTSLFIERNLGTYGLLITADNNGNSRLEAQGAVANLLFGIGGSEKLRISNNGKVGVGTTAPARLLHVYNNTASTASEIKIENSIAGYNAALQIKTTVSEWDVGSNILAAAGSFEVYERTGGSAGNRLTILSGGKVGIGTTSPLSLLDVFFTSSRRLLANYDDSLITLKASNNSSNPENLRLVADDIIFNTGTSGSGSERMRITDAGKVGIGTNSPSSLLEVTTTNNSSDGTFSCWSTTDGHSGSIIFTKSANGTIGTYAATADGERLGTITAYGTDSSNTKSQTTASIYFKQDGAATSARVPSRIEFHTSPPSNNQEERMVIKADGNVGIGTNAPAIMFDVKSSRTHNFIGRFVNTSTVGWGAYIEGGGDSADYSLLIRNQASSDLFAIMGDGEIRVANQTLVDSAGANYSMTFPNMGGIAMGSAYTYANIYGSGGDLYLKANAYPANLGAASKIYLVTANSSGGQASDVVVNNGKVGIGNASPYFPLHVQAPTGFNGEAKNNALLFDTTSATTGTGGGLAFGGFTNGTGGDVYHFANIQGIKENSTAGNYASAMLFSTRANGATPLVRMRITSDGTLDLISAKFKINGSAGSSGQTLTTDGSGNISWSSAGSGTISGSGTDNYIPRWNGTAALQDSSMIALDDGRVGVGVAGPSAIFHVKKTDSSAYWLGKFEADGTTQNALVCSTDTTSGVGVRFDMGGGSGTFTVLNSGKVGIGTTAPAQKLEVNGGSSAVQLQFKETSSGYHRVGLKKDGSKFHIGEPSNDGTTSFTEILTVDMNGDKVGIGTTAPNAILDISDATNDNLRIGTRGGNMNLFSVTDAGAGAPLAFEGTEFHFVTGKVGIGVTDPDQALEIGAAGKLKLSRADNSRSMLLYTDNSDGTIETDVDPILIKSAHRIRFSTNGANERMRITETGLVGIGTTAPAKPVHVNVETGWATLRLEGASDSGGEIEFYKSSTKSGSIFFSAAGDCQIRPLGVAEKFIILANGNVGIGTNAPSGKLEVRVASETGTSSTHGIRIGTASNAVNIGASDSGYAWLQTRGRRPLVASAHRRQCRYRDCCAFSETSR